MPRSHQPSPQPTETADARVYWFMQSHSDLLRSKSAQLRSICDDYVLALKRNAQSQGIDPALLNHLLAVEAHHLARACGDLFGQGNATASLLHAERPARERAATRLQAGARRWRVRRQYKRKCAFGLLLQIIIIFIIFIIFFLNL
jgi:hypothetical protein